MFCVYSVIQVGMMVVTELSVFFRLGWDEGCLTMKKGEVAKLTIAGHKGYGDRGFSAWGYPLFHIQ